MNIFDSITVTLVPIHKEGYKFIIAALAASLILGWLWDPLFWIGLLLTAWCAYFFRDPERVTPIDDDLVVAPADGRVSAVVQAMPPRELDLGDDEMTRISIFMNVFNCHINRAPVGGAIRQAVYKSGSFVNAELDKASEENERNGLVIEGPHGAIGVVQIAGLVARRIVCWRSVGDVVEAGERFGLIRFGSRLDVFLPVSATPRVTVGQTAVGGETVLAEYDTSKGRTVSRKS